MVSSLTSNSDSYSASVSEVSTILCYFGLRYNGTPLYFKITSLSLGKSFNNLRGYWSRLGILINIEIYLQRYNNTIFITRDSEVITRDSELIIFYPVCLCVCVPVCLSVCLSVCLYACLCHDVCPDDLTMKDWWHTNHILQVHYWGCLVVQVMFHALMTALMTWPGPVFYLISWVK